jgi:putative transposase
MIDRAHELPITRQAEILNISRGSVYYLPKPVSERDLKLMRRIDELHLELPFSGARMLRDLLRQGSVHVGRKHVATLMRRMGIEALYRRPNTSRQHPENPVYPYLLRHLAVTRPNQVWAMDFTCLPMARGFVYLAAVVDWYSRKVLAHRVSITMETDFCIEAVEEALAHYDKPGIFNTDQGSQFSRARRSLDCSSETVSASAWTARVPGATTCSSSGCGRTSSTRRSTSRLTKRSHRPATAWPSTSSSTTVAVRTRALTT